jgi:EAL domain-containing protein (putative c-di-GMP-specific phosphodiesterase class I)
MNEELHRKVALDNGIKDALLFSEFEMYYQAKVNIKDDSIIGAEALIRWNSPILGHVSPVEFIGYAEESGLIKEIGNFVLKDVFESIALLEKQFPFLVVSINVSSLQLQEDTFIDSVISLLKSTQANPKMIEFEITETKIMSDIEENIVKLLVLKKLGISISIDDFGTGYSSMSYLQKLPVDIIKIDKSFIDDILISKDSALLTNAMVSLSQALNLKTVAEGVEEEAQKEYLRAIGCDYMQGYLYSKPLPLNAFLAFVEEKEKNFSSTRMLNAIAQ